jgi:putative ATP-dependent endonuclease of OLD family
MHITKVIIKNYRCLANSAIELNDHLNILVGNNECGKSTLMEAIHLALSGYLNGRPVQSELHPFLFNANAVAQYIKLLLDKKPAVPPSILIELYMGDEEELAELKGTNNSANENVPGVVLKIEFNDEYQAEYAAYIADPAAIRTIPVEYYIVRWRNFAGNDITGRSVPIKSSFIDASTIRNNQAASRYVLDVVKDSLDDKQRVDLALSYRLMKDKFLQEKKVQDINKSLSAKQGHISNKALTMSLDTSARANWETGIMPHLDDIPMPLVGKGEQNSVKIKLAMESASKAHLFLIEEAENHLSFSNLNTLIKQISDRRGDRQLIITTHSSFVMNKLGMESVLLFTNGTCTTLKALQKDTQDYFLKLPGYDTLRMVLAKRMILAEGPSDELIIQKAFKMKFGVLPLEAGVDVMSVGSLAFKRFLQIADLLGIEVDVVTDNDGDVKRLEQKYEDYVTHPKITINYDDDEEARTLENQLVRDNGRETVNKILGKAYLTDEELLAYMKTNKTDSALKFFETNIPFKVPSNIDDAITQ